MAGFDTSSHTVVWCLYALATHPEAQVGGAEGGREGSKEGGAATPWCGACTRWPRTPRRRWVV
jgi:hypothetical protein